MGKVITALTAAIIFTGCGSFDLHLKKDAQVKSGIILIGAFESRSLSYDPFVAAEYREALKFEFIRRGVDAVLIPVNEDSLKNDWSRTSELAARYSGSLIIRGIITQRESGFLTDREINSSVNFLVYSQDGVEIGEGYFHVKDSASEEGVKRSAAVKFVNRLLKHITEGR